MNYSFPYVLKKSDKRLRYLTVTQIREETVSPYSLYREPIFDTDRTLGLTLLTVFSYADSFCCSYNSEKTVFCLTPSYPTGKGTSLSAFFILSSPLLLVLWVKEENAQSIQQLILANHFPSRVTILLIAHEPHNVYQSAFPINLLRNIGLQSVTTTHVCVLDSDLSLSGPFLRFFSSRILLEIAPIASQIARRRPARPSPPSDRVFAQRRGASLDRGSAGLHSARRVFASSSWTKIDSKREKRE